MGAVAAGITAFYMFRLVFMTFFGTNRADRHTWEHVHESTHTMTIPLIILAVGAALVGYFGVPHILGGDNHFHAFLAPVFGGGHGEAAAGHGEAAAAHGSAAMEWGLMILSVLIAFSGIALSYFLYYRNPDIPERMAERWATLHRWVYNKYYVDEFYEYVFVDGCKGLMRMLARFDMGTIVSGYGDPKPIGNPDFWNGLIPLRQGVRGWGEDLVVQEQTPSLAEMKAAHDAHSHGDEIDPIQPSYWKRHGVVDGLVNSFGLGGALFAYISGWIDMKFVDGALNAVQLIVLDMGRHMRRIQTGRIQIYLYYAVGGVLVVILLARAVSP